MESNAINLSDVSSISDEVTQSAPDFTDEEGKEPVSRHLPDKKSRAESVSSLLVVERDFQTENLDADQQPMGCTDTASAKGVLPVAAKFRKAKSSPSISSSSASC